VASRSPALSRRTREGRATLFVGSVDDLNPLRRCLDTIHTRSLDLASGSLREPDAALGMTFCQPRFATFLLCSRHQASRYFS
jgi:hypothetical protein